MGLETIYDKKWLEELNLNEKKEISKYITDITYKDEKGWISLIFGNYKCFINKIDSNVFVIDLYCDTEECGECYKISLSERVKIK